MRALIDFFLGNTMKNKPINQIDVPRDKENEKSNETVKETEKQNEQVKEKGKGDEVEILDGGQHTGNKHKEVI